MVCTECIYHKSALCECQFNEMVTLGLGLGRYTKCKKTHQILERCIFVIGFIIGSSIYKPLGYICREDFECVFLASEDKKKGHVMCYLKSYQINNDKNS